MTNPGRPSVAIVISLVLACGCVQLCIIDEPAIQTDCLSRTSDHTWHEKIWVYGDEQFIAQADLENWPGNGTAKSPYLIAGYYFDSWDKPFTVYHTAVHWIFMNNVLEGKHIDSHGGTWIQNVTNAAVINNEVFNRRFGMSITGGSGLEVSGNRIHDCWDNGFEVLAGMNNTIIENNLIEDIGDVGIYSGFSCNSVFRNNTVTNCRDYGVALLGITLNCTVTGNTILNCGTEVPQGGGVRVSGATSCEISENSITGCMATGIQTDSGDGISISGNMIVGSTGYGLLIKPACCGISAEFNTFVDNICPQICDNGTSSDITFNYYSEWDSPDANSDGYVDAPYLLAGDSGNADRYPLAVAGVVPSNEPRSLGGLPSYILLPLIGATVGLVGLVVFSLRRQDHF
jgi:parallel beta-helix repeat protein